MGELVSVIMPAYKSAKTIRNSIESVLSQSYKNLELIVVIDGKEDDTYEVCASINDTRLRIFQKENSGVVGAYCFGIKQAKGNYIAFCDSDDCYKQGFLEKGIGLIEEKSCDFVSFAYDVVDSQGHVVESIKNTLKNGLYDENRIKNEVIPHLVFNSFIREQMFILLVLRWNKIYKRELVNTFVDSLDYKCRQIEDNFFTINAVLNASSFYIDNDFKCYEYCIGESSISMGWQNDSILDAYFYTIERIAQRTQSVSQINPHQNDFLAYDNARIVFHRCARNADFKAAKALLGKIRKNERVGRVKFSELKMLKNQIYHIGLKLHLNWLLYMIFKR